jgi:hypothetical protein
MQIRLARLTLSIFALFRGQRFSPRLVISRLRPAQRRRTRQLRAKGAASIFALFQSPRVIIFLRAIAWTHELQHRQSQPLFRQALFDEPQLGIAQAGFEEAFIAVNASLVGTQATNSVTHNATPDVTALENSRPGRVCQDRRLQAAKQILRRTYVNWFTNDGHSGPLLPL